MKLSILAIVVFAGVTTACTGGNPLTPETVPSNVIYRCATQPRTYIGTDGTAHVEVDHYASPVPCPVVPID